MQIFKNSASRFFVAAFITTNSYYPVDLKVVRAQQYFPDFINAIVEVVALPQGAEARSGGALQIGRHLEVTESRFLNHSATEWKVGEILSRNHVTLSAPSPSEVQSLTVGQNPETLPKTRADLERLSPEEMDSLLSWLNWNGYHFLNREFQFIEGESFESLLKPFTKNARTYIRARLKDLTENFSTDLEDEIYSFVGKPYFLIETLMLPNGDPVGLSVAAIQKGCSQMDDNGEFVEVNHHYETLKEAEAANCIDNDVSWSGHMLFDFKGQIRENSEYMSWSGH